jgi:hypothetical protein
VLERLFLKAMIQPRYAMLLALAVAAAHLAVLAVVGRDLQEVLNHWDSHHYSRLVLGETDPALFAFYPLYPWSIRVLLLPGIAPQVVGAAFSIACSCLAVGLIARRWPAPLVSVAALLLSPASYAFQTHHTEGLFLLLSALALTDTRWWVAGLAATLAIVTRNQGVFVWLATLGLVWASSPIRRTAGLRVVTVGLGGVMAVFVFLAWQSIVAGDAFAFLHAQAGWNHARSLGDALATLALVPLWQQPSWSLVGHIVVAWLLLLGAWWLWRDGRPWHALYAVLAFVPFPLQADFGNSWRFAAVVFPVWLALGQRLAQAPKWLQGAAIAGLCVLNFRVTRAYALELWAY